MICLLASFITSRSALFNIVQNMSFVRWYAMCFCEEMTKNRLVDEIYSSRNAEFNLYSSWDAEPFFRLSDSKWEKEQGKRFSRKEISQHLGMANNIWFRPLCCIKCKCYHVLGLNCVCGRILQVRLNFPRDDRGTKDKGEEDWGRSGIGKVFPAGIGKKPNPWDHYGRANGAREQIYLFALLAN